MPGTVLAKALILALILVAATGCSIRHAMRVENRERIEVDTMIGELEGAPLVFVGERHDAAAHHRLQLQVVQAMKASGRPIAIGMEMFEDQSQASLNAWSGGRMPESAFRQVFERNWQNIPWGLYRDILIFARDNRIPIIGLNAPLKIVRKVSRQGFSSLGAGERAILPAGITAEVDERYLDLIGSAYFAHGGAGDAFRHICEAQMLRNRVMARHIADYLRLNPERAMVVLTGGVHARGKGGIPSELAKIPYKIVLPPIPGLDAGTVTGADADYLWEEP